ncbi:MAG: hypothetical protein IKG81_05260 [Bacteroidales bacterium]|nr:hypothetical protein [Bacteroidales bacterium]
MKTYFKIFVQGDSFNSRLYPRGLRSLVDESTYELIMSFKEVEGKHRFVYQNLKICLVVCPISNNNG